MCIGLDYVSLTNSKKYYAMAGNFSCYYILLDIDACVFLGWRGEILVWIMSKEASGRLTSFFQRCKVFIITKHVFIQPLDYLVKEKI